MLNQISINQQPRLSNENKNRSQNQQQQSRMYAEQNVKKGKISHIFNLLDYEKFYV